MVNTSEEKLKCSGELKVYLKLVNSLNSTTYWVLRVIGSPFTNSNFKLDTKDFLSLYRYAAKNRMSLLYLEALRRYGRLDSLEEEYSKLSNRYVEIVEAISRVTRVLQKAGVDYALFKTIRPYHEVTVDIDVLIFGTERREVIRPMNYAGYIFLNSGPISATFRDIEAGISVDIYEEVGASRIIYLDKDKLRRFIINRKLSNGEVVRSLDLSADLLAVIAHSIVKEHMYVLSEYYTTLNYLADANSGALSSFLSLVNECRMHSAVKTHLGTTALLHYGAHAFIPICLMKLLDELGLNNLELSRVKQMGFHMPHKYHPLTITKALIEKLGESKAKRSFALQASSMLNPKFASSVVRETLRRISRETY